MKIDAGGYRATVDEAGEGAPSRGAELVVLEARSVQTLLVRSQPQAIATRSRRIEGSLTAAP
jgi:hypothetical protein